MSGTLVHNLFQVLQTANVSSLMTVGLMVRVTTVVPARKNFAGEPASPLPGNDSGVVLNGSKRSL